MKEAFSQDKRVKWMSAMCAILVSIGRSVDLGTKAKEFNGVYKLIEDMVAALRCYDITKIFEVVLLYFLFLYGFGVLKSAKNIKAEVVSAGLPAIWFGVFMAIGYSYKAKGNWSLLFGSVAQMLKSGIYSLAYTILFFFGIVILFRMLEKIDIYDKKDKNSSKYKCIRWYLKNLEEHTFLTAFLTLFICYVPYIIVSYPGIFMGDTYNQIAQAYNLESYNFYMEFISDEVKLNNHHPVTHTMLLYICLRIGGLFNNYNFGFFLCSTLQIVFVLGVLTWVLGFLKEQGISIKIILVLMTYYVLHPRISNYMFLATKDVISTAFLMAFFITLYRIFLGRDSKKEYGFLVGSIIGALLFRKDGIYIVLITMIGLLIFHKKVRKKFSMIVVGVLVFNFFWNSILLPGLQITPSGRRDLLSFPCQQTARYIRDAGEEVTEEEKEIIDTIFDYDKLATKYNPVLSDPVKATFREKTATTTDLINYIKVWCGMFLKHPDIYFQAILHHKYDLFYFDSGKANLYSYSWSAEQMERINKLPDDVWELEIKHPESLKTIRDWYEYLREGLFSIPLINLVMVPSIYINGLLIYMFYGIKSRNKLIITMGIPMLVQVLLIIAGPCNAAYFRYVYPIAMILPIMFVLGLHVNRQKIKRCLNEKQE